MALELLALLLGGGILTKGVQGLFAISKAIGSYEGKTSKCLESLTEMVRDHEARLRDLEKKDARA